MTPNISNKNKYQNITIVLTKITWICFLLQELHIIMNIPIVHSNNLEFILFGGHPIYIHAQNISKWLCSAKASSFSTNIRKTSSCRYSYQTIVQISFHNVFMIPKPTINLKRNDNISNKISIIDTTMKLKQCIFGFIIKVFTLFLLYY